MNVLMFYNAQPVTSYPPQVVHRTRRQRTTRSSHSAFNSQEPTLLIYTSKRKVIRLAAQIFPEPTLCGKSSHPCYRSWHAPIASSCVRYPHQQEHADRWSRNCLRFTKGLKRLRKPPAAHSLNHAVPPCHQQSPPGSNATLLV